MTAGDDSIERQHARELRLAELRSWEYKRLRDNLIACYGYERAAPILAGLDDEANRDLEIWRTLGHPERRGAG